ncbi:MAG TPA: ABC transporter substrate-binding protein [Vicinamibacterales bacterium]|nr:ABC transporter substrate-binding protein [Vicinamibacterales bacterium]
MSVEGLARIAENGRPEPRLAEKWTVTPDGLSIVVQLRPAVKFHDGSLVTADAVARTLREQLPPFMGPAYEDIDEIQAPNEHEIVIKFRQASPFLLEALEVPVRKPGANVGTGPFVPVPSESTIELRANDDYYLGPPSIRRVVVANYPSLRSAWADLLRDRIDMLYEVGPDAMDSLSGSKSVSIASFTRPYQYVIAFNLSSPNLRSAAIRRALNAAVDRDALVREGLQGRGSPSAGPIWPQHWAFSTDLPKFQFAPMEAAEQLGESKSARGSIRLRFTCLVPGQYERLALVLKRQLELVGVDMQIVEVSPDSIFEALNTSSFEAVFLDMVSGPSFFRIYEWWHSGGSLNLGALGSAPIDAELDRVRHAASDDAYRQAIASFQRAIVNDPPAIFLAWSERARAVNRRFDVAAEPGRDILTTLRLWRPTTDLQYVGRN